MNLNEDLTCLDTVSKGKENKRENWTGRFDFLLSCIGYAIGLGNVWRFPYMCFKNGGGAFLIPYLIMVIIVGLPMFFFELALGQFSSRGPITIWILSPFFKGIGWSMFIISAIVGVYYNVIIAWALFYLVASFRKKLLWTDCTNEWNDERCSIKYSNETKYGVQTPAEQYWEKKVLGMTNYVGDVRKVEDSLGSPQYYLLLSLFISWLAVFVALSRGVKTSGKIVYITATLPFVVLIILFIYGMTLDGAIDGIKYFIIPKWNQLGRVQNWVDAASQIVYTFGVAFGSLHTMASYNEFSNNCYHDAVIVGIINCSTSIFAGFTIFTFLGYLAKRSLGDGSRIDEIVKSGPGLAFVAYPEALSDMPLAPVWSTLFFIMIAFLGIDSQFGMLEAVVSGIVDEYPTFICNAKRRLLLVFIMCVVLFLLGIPLICQGGIYYFELINDRSASLSLLLVGLFELIAVCHVYGIRNFCKDIKMMLGYEPNYYWKICWFILTPLSIITLFIAWCIQFKDVSYGDYVLPLGMQIAGYVMIAMGVSAIPIFMIYEVIKHKSFLKALKSEKTWGPINACDRICDERYNNESDVESNKDKEIPFESKNCFKYYEVQ